MPLWTSTTPPTYKKDAILNDKGWADKDTKELLVSMNVTSEEKADYTTMNTPTPPIEVSIVDLVVDTQYTIAVAGDSDWTLVGAIDNNVGTSFTAIGTGTGTGIANPV